MWKAPRCKHNPCCKFLRFALGFFAVSMLFAENQHTQFIKEFGVLKSRIESEGPELQIMLLTNTAVVDWLMKHINHTDKALGLRRAQ